MQEEEVDRGSERGEMDAGLQMDTGAVLVEMAGTVVVLVGGVNWPLAPFSELTSLVGELFFLAGRTLFWPPFCCCCCCWRHFARRFLNQTCTRDSGRLIFSATSSRMNMSGYRVLANNASKTSSCARVKVVLSRLCFRGVAG